MSGAAASPHAQTTDQKMAALERSLAYEHAVSTIDYHTLSKYDDAHVEWFDLNTAGSAEILELVLESVAYLEWRGLIEHHPANPDLITVLDEDAVEVTEEIEAAR